MNLSRYILNLHGFFLTNRQRFREIQIDEIREGRPILVSDFYDYL
jgi:hypothetical protein